MAHKISWRVSACRVSFYLLVFVFMYCFLHLTVRVELTAAERLIKRPKNVAVTKHWTKRLCCVQKALQKENYGFLHSWRRWCGSALSYIMVHQNWASCGFFTWLQVSSAPRVNHNMSPCSQWVPRAYNAPRFCSRTMVVSHNHSTVVQNINLATTHGATYCWLI